MPLGQTYYELLAVPQNASRSEIKSAFRRLSLQIHPDVNHHDPEAQANFRLLRHAHDILVDASSREVYDSQLKKRAGARRSTLNPRAGGFRADIELPTVADMLDATLSHLNYVLWEVEDLLCSDSSFQVEVAGTPLIAYLAQALGFLDRWVLGPGGQPDYFHEARRIPDQSDPFPTHFGIDNGHRPYVNIKDYFFDVRIRFNRFVGNTSCLDLSAIIEGTPVRLVDSIIEAHDYVRHYVSEVQSVLDGRVEHVAPFVHSRACFAKATPTQTRW